MNNENNNDGKILRSGIIEFDIEIDDIIKNSIPEEVYNQLGDMTPPITRAAGDNLQSGNFQGGTSNSQIQAKIYWWEKESATAGYCTIAADLYFYTQYNWSSSALSESYITINGANKKLGTSVGIGGTGERKVMSHSVHMQTFPSQTIPIAGGVQIRGTYGGVYYDTISISKNITLKGPAKMSSCVKTSTTGYSNIKKIYVKTSTTGYSLVKEAYVKNGTTSYVKIK